MAALRYAFNQPMGIVVINLIRRVTASVKSSGDNFAFRAEWHMLRACNHRRGQRILNNPRTLQRVIQIPSA